MKKKSKIEKLENTEEMIIQNKKKPNEFGFEILFLKKSMIQFDSEPKRIVAHPY